MKLHRWTVLLSSLLLLALPTAAVGAAGVQVRFEKTVIDADSKGEATGVMDVNRSGHLSVVCGESWYEPTDKSLRQWQKHPIRKIEYKMEYFDDFANLVLDVNGDGYREREDKQLFSTCGQRFVGTEGWVSSADARTDRSNVSSPAFLADYKKVLGAYTAKTGRVLHHGMDFFDCIRTRREPVANAQVMYESMLLNIAADLCGLLQRNLKFDLKKAEFIGDDEANRLRSRGMREPWCVLAGT